MDKTHRSFWMILGGVLVASPLHASVVGDRSDEPSLPDPRNPLCDPKAVYKLEIIELTNKLAPFPEILPGSGDGLIVKPWVGATAYVDFIRQDPANGKFEYSVLGALGQLCNIPDGVEGGR